jgi:hypothetical protein
MLNNTCSSNARDSRSGGIDGRPLLAYNHAKLRHISCNTASTMARIGRSR